MPESLQVTVMSDVYNINILTESATRGYGKTFIVSTSRDIKQYISTCDIYQKAKH